MENTIHSVILLVLLAPLTGALIAGLLGKKIGRSASHWVTILGVATALAGSIFLFKWMVFDHVPAYQGVLYTWGKSGQFGFDIGVLVDRLTVVMLVTVTFISLLVHIYSIGYMHDDSGYQRFFCYMSLFTFSMLALVLADNFLLMFFGWEGVGLVSYLLIGFWFEKESAVQGSLKAFLVNRVGDFGFLLGLGAILSAVGSLKYSTVFEHASQLASSTLSILPGMEWSLVTVICLLLFIGAMGKSAQVPLHVWLPESMEGPTPISALIHAATMVTAGIYMVARMSPLFELSPVALNVVLITGATGALFLGILGVVQNDIKRVVAYSTMSQLGYMMAANGVSAFSAGIFHLMTHAVFKALLFLAAGSVIMAMHHEQDMRKMGGLARRIPVTYLTFLIGSIALIALPPFSGFYSKDAIIDAVHLSNLPGAGYAYVCLVLGAFFTALYTFRALFMTFHGKPRMSEETYHHVEESPKVVTVPLIILAIFSVFTGYVLAEPMLYSSPSLLGNTITVFPEFDVLATMRSHFHGLWNLAAHSLTTITFWVTVAGVVMAWLCYLVFPKVPAVLASRLPWLYEILIKKYGFDRFNEVVFVKGTEKLSHFFYRFTDMKIIDEFFVNGSGTRVEKLSGLIRRMQSGYLYHYALVMILGLVGLLIWVF